jgi:hypothetical protein
MLSGGNPETWNGWVHGIAFLLIIATGVLAPLTMALAVRGDAGWRPIAVVSVAASALFVVFLFLPWGNASFLLAIVTLFAWMAAIAVRLATHQQAQQDQQAPWPLSLRSRLDESDRTRMPGRLYPAAQVKVHHDPVDVC